MTTTYKALIILVVLFALGALAYTIRPATDGQAREGTEKLTAEEVVDLEVQAQQEFEAEGGEY